MFVKQFGIQRSGTNYTKALIEINFPGVKVLSSTLGNKHNAPNMESMLSERENLSEENFDSLSLSFLKNCDLKKDLPYIFVSKEPVSWVLSFYNLRALKKPKVYKKLTSEHVDEFLDFYFKLHLSWVKFVRNNKIKKFYFVDYHKVLKNPGLFIDNFEILTGFESKRKFERILRFENSMKRGTEEMTGMKLLSSNEFDQTYYLNNNSIDDIDQNILKYLVIAFSNRLLCYGELRDMFNLTVINEVSKKIIQ